MFCSLARDFTKRKRANVRSEVFEIGVCVLSSNHAHRPRPAPTRRSGPCAKPPCGAEQSAASSTSRNKAAAASVSLSLSLSLSGRCPRGTPCLALFDSKLARAGGRSTKRLASSPPTGTSAFASLRKAPLASSFQETEKEKSPLSLSLSLSPPDFARSPRWSLGVSRPSSCSAASRASRSRAPAGPGVRPPRYSAAICVLLSPRNSVVSSIYPIRTIESCNDMKHVSRGFPEDAKIVQSPTPLRPLSKHQLLNRKSRTCRWTLRPVTDIDLVACVFDYEYRELKRARGLAALWWKD